MRTPITLSVSSSVKVRSSRGFRPSQDAESILSQTDSFSGFFLRQGCMASNGGAGGAVVTSEERAEGHEARVLRRVTGLLLRTLETLEDIGLQLNSTCPKER